MKATIESKTYIGVLGEKIICDHPITRERIKQTKQLKPIIQMTLEGEIIGEYESLHDLQRKN